MRFGRLTAVSRSGKTKCGNYKWDCLCDCGGVVTVKSGSLTRDSGTRSCGCLLAEKNAERNTTHGLSGHHLYNIWLSIKARCANLNDPRYGGRGISVCKTWLNNFEKFYSFSMKNGWRPGLEIDRINNNKGYSPDNCRFTTRIVNCENKRTSKVWVIDGREYPSSRKAAKGENVHIGTIREWCGCGKKRRGYGSEKPGCYAYKTYGG